jgi:D-glycero-alpha-D-manno-heptose-7-phosphate kinase
MAAGISNPAINDMYAQAASAGAIAGKIAGAGGGGFLLLIVPREHQNTVYQAMQPFRELPFMVEGSGSKVIFDDRSYASK